MDIIEGQLKELVELFTRLGIEHKVEEDKILIPVSEEKKVWKDMTLVTVGEATFMFNTKGIYCPPIIEP